MLDLREIAHALGGEVSGAQVLAPGPGHSRKDRSLSVRLSTDAPDGFLAHSHCGDDWRDCRDYVRERLGIERPRGVSARSAPKPQVGSREKFAHRGRVSDDDERIADAIALFRESVDPRGTAAERYFVSRRLEVADLASRVLRWNERIGAVIALFRNIHTGGPQAVARTFLDADARKIERKFLGPVGGAALMLDAFDAVTGGIHIGEGLETCQAARQLGLRPTWALGSAGAIAAFPILAGVECLTLLGENDLASENAVRTCGERWHEANRIVLINRPLKVKDLNDAIRRTT